MLVWLMTVNIFTANERESLATTKDKTIMNFYQSLHLISCAHGKGC